MFFSQKSALDQTITADDHKLKIQSKLFKMIASFKIYYWYIWLLWKQKCNKFLIHLIELIQKSNKSMCTLLFIIKFTHFVMLEKPIKHLFDYHLYILCI